MRADRLDRSRGVRQYRVSPFVVHNERATAQVEKPASDYDSRGNYVGPTKADKGLKGGSCNITACQKPGAVWYNHSMDKYYCTKCARDLNRVNWDAVKTYGYELCTLDPEFA
jgi:hypothetical protein